MSKGRVFSKYAGNPVIKASDISEEVMYVLNPGAVKVNGEYIVMMDAATLAQPICFWIARSKDGVNFTPDPQPVKWPEPDPIHPEDCVYGPRITNIGDEYILMYASSNVKFGVRVGIVKTKDFETFERVATGSEQGNRNAVLFPEKINGLYARLDRPFGSASERCDLWISYSPDLVFWGKSQPLLPVRPGYWDDHKIGAGAVPIKTDKGWLEIYHGVSKTCNGFIYRLGAVILDLEDPAKVLARSEDAILWPEYDYELKGRVDNVVFTCNTILEDNGTVKMYYGAADSCIGMAEAKLNDIIEACYRKNPFILRV